MKNRMTMLTIFLTIIFTLTSCNTKADGKTTPQNVDTLKASYTVDSLKIEKDFLYNQYTLEDTYPYNDTTRVFQWGKIKAKLFMLDSIQEQKVQWAVLQNYKNRNGQPPLMKGSLQNEYKHATDSFGIERGQSIPFYTMGDTLNVKRYVRDGALVRVLGEEGGFTKVNSLRFGGEWLIPSKYAEAISDTVVFKKAVFVDRTNQNIATLEKVNDKWLVRSMNPTSTGLKRPPFKYETPTGIFVVQDKLRKMIYYADGSRDYGGFSPYASRFSGGAYLHGVPIDLPRRKEVEFSKTLGTTPRSHMCVRNATSHAQFLFDWATVDQTVVVVFD